MKLAGRICVVTGAARGIGRAISRAYEREGADNGREMELFVKGGYSVLETLSIATAHGADLIGLDAGRLLPGRLADILVVDGNPLDDIALLRNPDNLRVFKGGIEAVARPN